MKTRDTVAVTSRPGLRALLLGLLLLASTVLTLAGIELALRLAKGAGLAGVPDRTAQISMIGHVYPGAFNPDLGYVPMPGASARNTVWKTAAHITWEGVRSNGAEQPAPEGVPIVVVGDSFTYGDEVNDRDTWPAALERLVQRPVINGGVFGYGLDQAVLRSEVLMRDSAADLLIVSLIPDDVTRCEYSYRYSWKPYFDVQDGALVRRNDPVPGPSEPPPGENRLRRSLRASFLADFVLRRLDPNNWLVRGSVRVHDRGEEVSRLLLDRLVDTAQARGHGLLIVVQWLPVSDMQRAQPLIERARERGVDLLLIEEPLRRAIEAPNATQEDFFHVRSLAGGATQVGHMSAEGNHFVATKIAERLAASP